LSGNYHFENEPGTFGLVNIFINISCITTEKLFRIKVLTGKVVSRLFHSEY